MTTHNPTGTLDIIVGGQFGSEAKGHVTKRVIEQVRQMWGSKPSQQIVNVRVAGPNAGHCVRDDKGQKFALRTIPVGAVYQSVQLHIAPGSEIDPLVFHDEVMMLAEGGHSVEGRLTVSAEATVLNERHIAQETGMQARMGSTGKGIGACRSERLMRVADRVKDDPTMVELIRSVGGEVVDSGYRLSTDDHIVIEGTQGYGLGLHAGFYPQCTSSDCRAIDFAAMANVNPWDFRSFTPWVVARVYPIRVAGNSGPLAGEHTWEELGLPEEYTTVTHKVRRVGEWDPALIRSAVTANGIGQSVVALTMLDQKFGEVQGHSSPLFDNQPDWSNEVFDFISEMERDAGAPIRLVTTGEDTGVWL